eukprot:765283-Hanusia_phi.AAC.6
MTRRRGEGRKERGKRGGGGGDMRSELRQARADSDRGPTESEGSACEHCVPEEATTEGVSKLR